MAQTLDPMLADGVRAALGGVNITGAYYGCEAFNAVAGIALVALTTTNHPTLWNKSNSGVALGIRSVTLQQLSDGNNAPGMIVWGYTASTGSAAATGAPIAAFTDVAGNGYAHASGSVCSRYTGGSSYTPKAAFAAAACTFTAAPVVAGPVGQTLHTGVAGTAIAPWSCVIPYAKVLAPGAALSIACNTTTTTVKYYIKIDFDEIVLA